MIAVSLLVIITAIVYGSFSSVATSMETAQTATEELRLRQFLSRYLMQNLSQAYPDWQPGAAMRLSDTQGLDGLGNAPAGRGGNNQGNARAAFASQLPAQGAPLIRHWLEGEDGSGAGGPEDVLSFTTTAPLLGHTALPGMLKQVVLEIVREGGDEGTAFTDAAPEDARSFLQVTETPVMVDPDEIENAALGAPLEDPSKLIEESEENFDAPGWRVPARSLNVQYFDEKEWVDDWDSVELGRLPWAVRIGVTFEKTQEELSEASAAGVDPEEDPDFLFVLTLPGGEGVIEDAPQLNIEALQLANVQNDPTNPNRPNQPNQPNQPRLPTGASSNNVSLWVAGNAAGAITGVPGGASPGRQNIVGSPTGPNSSFSGQRR